MTRLTAVLIVLAVVLLLASGVLAARSPYGSPSYHGPSKWIHGKSTITHITYPKWLGWITWFAAGAISGTILKRTIRSDSRLLKRLLLGFVVGAATWFVLTNLGYIVRNGFFESFWFVAMMVAKYAAIAGVGVALFGLLRPITATLKGTIAAFAATWAAIFIQGLVSILLFLRSLPTQHHSPNAVILAAIASSALSAALSALGLCLFGRQMTAQTQAETLAPASDT